MQVKENFESDSIRRDDPEVLFKVVQPIEVGIIAKPTYKVQTGIGKYI